MASPTIDTASLNEEQQLALQQYISVTDQDLPAAIALLQKCQWNVQIAITRFFDGDAGTIDPVAEAARAAAAAAAAPPPPPPPSSNRRAETLLDSIPTRANGRSSRGVGLGEAPRVVATPESRLIQPVPFPFNVLLLPFNLTYIIFQRVLGTIGYMFPIIPRLLARFWSGRSSRPSRDTGRRPLAPKDTAARFIREFEEDYGVTHGEIPFFEGGYANAFDAAKRDLKYLLVVLLSPEHDDTAPFVRQTLLSQELKDFITAPANNVVLWGGTVQDAEAYQVANALNATKFPYTCLIVHTPSVSSTAMSKIATTSGPITTSELISKLQAGINAQAEELDRVRRQRQEQQASRNLRQEQESAYERSLAQDREKARRRKEEEAARAIAEKEEIDRQSRKADKAQKLAQWRRWRAQSLLDEADASDNDAVRVSIRLSNGERVIRRFPPDADLEEVYAFVECYGFDATNEKSVEKPMGYEHTFNFRLVSPMPREVFELEKGGSIRHRLGRSVNLLVEATASDEDDDDDDDDDKAHEDTAVPA